MESWEGSWCFIMIKLSQNFPFILHHYYTIRNLQVLHDSRKRYGGKIESSQCLEGYFIKTLCIKFNLWVKVWQTKIWNSNGTLQPVSKLEWGGTYGAAEILVINNIALVWCLWKIVDEMFHLKNRKQNYKERVKNKLNLQPSSPLHLLFKST